jgi:HEAT repeat protein
VLAVLFVFASPFSARQNTQVSLTPLQAAIQRQQTRLSSTDPEDRRDALMRLAELHHSSASTVAASALDDAIPSVRVAAGNAVLWLPADESARLLIPLLKDKVEFVRQEAAYSLGKTHSRVAVAPLVEFLGFEKLSGPRGAAVVSLGTLRDEGGVVALARLIAPELGGSAEKKKSRLEQNEFVLRAAARSLGQIRSKAGVPALTSLLSNEKAPIDARREAAIALGMIGDASAANALREQLSSPDPYLARAAYESLRKLQSN